MAPRYTSAEALLQNIKRGILDPNRLRVLVRNEAACIYLLPEGEQEGPENLLDIAEEIAQIDSDKFFFALMECMGLRARRV